MKSLRHYKAAVADLSFSLELIDSVNEHFPQYRVQVRPVKRQLRRLERQYDKRLSIELAKEKHSHE